MGDNAIREDAVNREEEKQQEQPLSDREQMMEQLAEAREAQLTGAVRDDENREGAQQQEKQVRHEDSDTDRPIRLKIDGEELEMPLSEVVKGFQKDATASKRLQEAANLRKELEAREADLKAREEQLSRKPDDAGESTGEDDDDIDAALDALLEGDRDKFKEVLKQVKGRPETSTPADKDMGKLVDERLEQREVAREHAKAQEEFKKQYTDVYEDPDLLAAANNRYYAKLNEGKSITEAMLEAGKETREWLREKAGVKESSLEEKARRKSNLLNLPGTGARSGSRSDDDNAPEDRRSVIADIMKSRGQT